MAARKKKKKPLGRNEGLRGFVPAPGDNLRLLKQTAYYHRKAAEEAVKLGVMEKHEAKLHKSSPGFRTIIRNRIRWAKKIDHYIDIGLAKPESREPYIRDGIERAAIDKAIKRTRQNIEFQESKGRKEAAKKVLNGEMDVSAVPLTVQKAVHLELAKRELARRKLIHFTTRNKPDYQAGWFHIELAEELDKFIADIEAGLSPRLLIEAPPRHGKSELTSRQLPAFVLGKHPEWEIIAASYALSLALDMSRDVQAILQTEEYKQLFPLTRIDPKKASAEDWGTYRKNGAYLAAGVGGPITGRGAHALIIDDPFKNRADADSAIERQNIWNWFTSTAYTRLAPGGGVVVMATRWHFDDLTGRLRAQQAAAENIEKETGKWPENVDRWRIVSYPAVATRDEKHRKAGQPLHPERYTLNALMRIKNTIGPRDWSALYQQTPTADDGEFFKKPKFRYYQSANLSDLDIFAAADLAISKKESADYTAFAVMGIDSAENLYLLDIRRDRWDAKEIIDQIFDLQRMYRPRLFGIEEGQIEKALGPFLDERIRKEKMYDLALELLKPGKRDKEMRARPMQGLIGQGRVLFPQGALWLPDFENELLQFPNGKHDDQVDALAWIGQMLASVNFTPRRFAPKKGWRDKLKRLGQPAARSGNAMAA